MEWQLEDAKNELLQVVRKTQNEPQVIKVEGEEKAVLISKEYFCKLTGQDSLASFLQNSPWADVELDVSRSKDTGREIDF